MFLIQKKSTWEIHRQSLIPPLSYYVYILEIYLINYVAG